MADAKPTRLATAALLLLAGSMWMLPAFVPTIGRQGVTPESGVLRGTVSSPRIDVHKSVDSAAAVGVLAIAALAFAADRKPRPQTVTPRHFFGGPAAPTPPPKKATSYKDFNDPWLTSADLGFDPLNLAIQGGTFDKAQSAVPETTYYNYRESEVKHGRFAMGAFLAIFAESADRGAVLKQLGVAGAEDTLDGTLGLDEVQLPVLLIGIGIQALAEYNLQQGEADGTFLAVEYKKDRLPGDLGFDPLGLSKGGGADVIGLHNTEVNAGRLAMIGVTTFLLKEFVIKDPELASKIL